MAATTMNRYQSNFRGGYGAGMGAGGMGGAGLVAAVVVATMAVRIAALADIMLVAVASLMAVYRRTTAMAVSAAAVDQ